MIGEVSLWRRFYKKNFYYHNQVQELVSKLISQDASVLEINTRGGEMLGHLKNPVKVGVEGRAEFYKLAQRRSKKNNFEVVQSLIRLRKRKFDHVLFSHTFSETDDVQSLVKKIRKCCKPKTRIVVLNFNYLWKPVLDFAEKIDLKIPSKRQPNWLSQTDVDNLFYLENFEKVKGGGAFLFPYQIPMISTLINKYISQLPLISNFCLVKYSIYRPCQTQKDYSVSIIIPARNEAGNMKGIFKKIPKIGKEIEIIFVEGHSNDGTYGVIKNEINNYKGNISVRLYKQRGIGKGDAVRFGFARAKKDVLMILDADLTVEPKELVKFYDAISSGKGELVMGSRLVYPMETLAMRTLNVFANKFFSLVFSFLLNQKIKDTLCGTKVVLREDYKKIEKNRYIFGNFDPFGDFDLIFGAAKLNLKIIEIPIRYRERTYGTTNISRFKHGLLLIKMVIFAAIRLKFV